MPEVVPFLVFALSGGAIPMALTVLQVLAIDLGTDILPALALSREPAEPGLMDQPPRSRRENVIRAGMLARAWGFLGLISATLVMARRATGPDSGPKDSRRDGPKVPGVSGVDSRS